MLKNSPQKIVLGCTHYPFLLPVLTKFAPSDLFIDPASYFAQYIKNDLSDRSLLADKKLSEDEFYVSSNPANFKESAQMFCKLEKAPELLVI